MDEQPTSRRKKIPAGRNVYFVQCNQNGPIKIGLALNVRKRLIGLRTACPYPIYLRGVMRNMGMMRENALHRMFAQYRIHDEWYQPVPELIAFIKQHSEFTKKPNSFEGMPYGWGPEVKPFDANMVDRNGQKIGESRRGLQPKKQNPKRPRKVVSFKEWEKL